MAKLLETIRGWFGKKKGPASLRQASTPIPVIPREKKERRPSRPPRGDQPGRQPKGDTAQRPPRGEGRPPRSEQSGRPAPPAREGSRPPRDEQQQRERRPERRQTPRPPRERAPEVAAPPAPVFIPDTWEVTEFSVPAVEGQSRFHDFDLPREIMHAIADLNFQYCTPIQAQLLGKVLAGLDATGRAQTGTGKTAAFLINILTHLMKNPQLERRKGMPRALIMAPTRELVLQIEKDARALSKYIECNVIAVFGGMEYVKQRSLLAERNVDIVVATPGRLLDFKRKGDVNLSKVEFMVIDEADRMLDMGFIPDMRKIIESIPPKGKRQTMFFSATITPEVNRLAAQWTREPVHVNVAPEQVAVTTVDQVVYIVTADEKFRVLVNMIINQDLERVIIFGNRRDETQALKEKLMSYGLSCGLLSGDVTQEQRIKTLENFRNGLIRVLVATDVAARGIHVDAVSHVVNYNLPMDPEDYVHRIGRTGRAGASGISVSFATEYDSELIPAIETYLGKPLASVYPPDQWLLPLPPPDPSLVKTHAHAARKPHPGGSRRGGRSGGGRGRAPKK